jgi:hypothetical protein
MVVAAAIARGRGAGGRLALALARCCAASREPVREAARGGAAADVGVHGRGHRRGLVLGGRLLGRHGTCEQVRERLQFMLGVLVVEETGG